MHPPQQGHEGFKRQVVFRIGADDWPLLEAAAHKHGSIQAAVLAGIRNLASCPAQAKPHTNSAPAKTADKPKTEHTPASEPIASDPDEELTVREAARLLDLKTGTVAGYIRSGRLPGRYDDGPTWRGWVTPRGAVSNYQRTRQA